MNRSLVAATLVVLALVRASSSAGATILVRAGADLQAALDQARSGDVILLEAGATFVGNFVLPARPVAGDPITVRSAATDPRLPAEMTRVRPDVADLLPKLRSPNGEPALRTAPRSRGWRIVLVEFLANAGGAGDIVRLGDGGAAQSTAETVPADLVLDRCYVHGDARSGQKRGIALNSGNTTIQNSWVSDIKMAGQDSQAITGWNGPGPYRVLNNYLEAAGQAFMLGGADPAIPNLVPTDVTFSANHVTRPVGWRAEAWQVKNLLELKNARGVWIDGNLFENNWRGAQSGYAILFTPRNQDGQAPWSTVENVHFRYNVVRHVAAAVSLLGRDSPNRSGQARGIEISHNLVYDVDSSWGGNGEFLLIGDGPADVAIEHNTVLQSGNILSAYGGSGAQPEAIRGFVFRFNLVRHNAYGVHGNDRGVGNDTLTGYFPNAVFNRNVIAGGSPGLYPGDNAFPSVSAFERYFVDPAGGDFHLQATNVSRDGEAPGADIDEVNRAWRAAESGAYRDSPRFQHGRERERDKRIR
jgi:hypothetical protein